MLSGFAERPVIDKTGLTEFAYCTPEGYDPPAVIRQLGPGRPRGAPPVPKAADPGSVSIFTSIITRDLRSTISVIRSNCYRSLILCPARSIFRPTR